MLILMFRAGGRRYAIDAARVAEVVPRVRLRPLPHAPAHLAGVFDYRGEVVTVLDVGVLLGAEPAPDRLNTRVILADRRADPRATDSPRALLGLLAADVDDLATVDPAAFVPTPVPIPTAPYLGGVAEIGSGMVQLLLVARVLDAPTA